MSFLIGIALGLAVFVMMRYQYHMGWRMGVIRAYCAMDMKESAAMRLRYAKEWKVIDAFEAEVVAQMIEDQTPSP
jgi:hypothetical protein